MTDAKAVAATTTATEYIYVGKCKHNTFYVGSTIDPETRLAEHRAGTGSAWTHEHPMIKYAELKRKTHAFEEQTKLYEYVDLYGWERVRGGTFSCVNPTKQQVEELMKVVQQERSACFGCGAKGHYIADCDGGGGAAAPEVGPRQQRLPPADTRQQRRPPPADRRKRQPPVCYGCGEPGHYKPDCPVVRMRCSACGRDGHLAKVCTRVERPVVTCYGCREPGHYKPDCPYVNTACCECGAKGHPVSGCAIRAGPAATAAAGAVTERSALEAIGEWVYKFVTGRK